MFLKFKNRNLKAQILKQIEHTNPNAISMEEAYFFKGSLTLEDVPVLDVLRNFSNLNSLSLINTDIENLNFLSSIKGLKKLRLISNARLNDLSGLKYVKDLSELEISFKDFTEIKTEPISECKKLTSLSCKNIPVPKLNLISDMERLAYARLKKCHLFDTNSFANDYLHQLDLSYNNITDIDYLSELYPFLTNLNLAFNNIVDPTEFYRFKKLRHLALEGNPLDDIDEIKQNIFERNKE